MFFINSLYAAALMSYLKVEAMTVDNGNFCDKQVLYARKRRTFTQLLAEFFENIFLALHFTFNGPFGIVPHPSCKAQAVCDILGKIAESDALHAARDGDCESLYHSATTFWKRN